MYEKKLGGITMCKFYAEVKENGAVARCNSFDNEYFSFKYEKNDDSIKGVLTAKKGFEMQSLVVEYDKDFDDDDLFYANGYQAWTTSREFSKNDKFDGLIKAANINKFLKHIFHIRRECLSALFVLYVGTDIFFIKLQY